MRVSLVHGNFQVYCLYNKLSIEHSSILGFFQYYCFYSDVPFLITVFLCNNDSRYKAFSYNISRYNIFFQQSQKNVTFLPVGNFELLRMIKGQILQIHTRSINSQFIFININSINLLIVDYPDQSYPRLITPA